MGEFWSKDTQIDVVGLRDDGWTDIGECKWGQVRSSSRLVKELADKVTAYPNSRNATIGRHVFVRGKIPKVAFKDESVRLYPLKTCIKSCSERNDRIIFTVFQHRLKNGSMSFGQIQFS